jgi:uncharacterized protein YndB with AHSA1/START domain
VSQGIRVALDRSVEIPAPAAQVWALISDWAGMLRWWRPAGGCRHLADISSASRDRIPAGHRQIAIIGPGHVGVTLAYALC